MNAPVTAGIQPLEGIPVQKLLEGLARLYQLVLVLDSEGRVAWLSNEMGTLCSCTEGSLGQDARDIFPEAHKFRREFAIRSQLRKQGFFSNMQMEFQNAAGDRIPVELSILPIHVESSDKPLYVAIARLRDDRSAPLEGDDRNAQTLAAILDNAPEAVLAVDERGFITYANPIVQRLVGQPPARLVGQPIAQLLSQVDEIERLVASLAPGEGSNNLDLKLRRADGTQVPVFASVSGLRTNDETLRGTVLLLRDATERRSTELALERKNSELEHCVHSLAHDLRSPLVALLGFSRLLRQDYGEQMDDTGLHFIDRIEQAGRTMEELIHDLLEFSRIGQGGDRRAMVDPRSVLLQIAAEMKPRLEALGTKLELPEHPPLIYCDRTRLYQVFSNLVGNAIEHMGPCENPSVTIETWDAAESHEVAVRDPGRGIAPENHARIFEIFQSLGPRADGRRGSGIGLGIVKKIAETHGGRVWVESEPGMGATFRLSLPKRKQV